MRNFLSKVRPIIWSVLLLIAASIILQCGISYFVPNFDILASKDGGKIVFTALIFVALYSFVKQQPTEFRSAWIVRNFLFLKQKSALMYFVKYFSLFFSLHALFLTICYAAGYAELQFPSIVLYKLIGQLIFGFGATFMLAFTEEVMFRGTLFPYFVQFLRPFSAALVTSFCFMIVHFLPNPITQLQQDLPIGTGLFLLGLMLNLIYIKTGSMYANIGTHAGLVYVKVVLRKIRFFVFSSTITLPWFLHSDLRQSPLVHGLFFLIIVGLIINMRKQLFSIPHKTP